MISTTSTSCCGDGDSQRGSECPSSKSGYHCWHTPFNNGVYWSTVAPDPRCCHCGTYESQTHGPYHPQNITKWQTSGVTWTNPSWTIVGNDGNLTYTVPNTTTTWASNGTATITIPANGSGITSNGVPLGNVSGYATSGYSQASCCVNGCDGINTGCSFCPPKL